MTVHVDAILGKLAKERRERVGVSATTMNLVAFVEDRTLLDWLSERTKAVAAKHPSRSILLDASHGEHSTQAHSECKEIGDTLLTQSERIVLGIKGMSGDALASALHALVVPNVQTVLLWAGAHLTADPRFFALAALADSLVLDSSRTGSESGTLRELFAFLGTGEHPSVRDLAFMRLLPWQEMVAQFFDDPDLAADLPSIDRVEVAAGSRAESYYFVGWLVSRLGWMLEGPSSLRNARGDAIELVLAHEGEPRRVTRVALRGDSATYSAEVEAKDPEIVCLTVTGKKKRPPRCMPLHHVDVVTLVETAILVPRSGEVFHESVEAVRTLVEQA